MLIRSNDIINVSEIDVEEEWMRMNKKKKNEIVNDLWVL